MYRDTSPPLEGICSATHGSTTGKYWLLVVNDARSMSWSFVLTNKNIQARVLLDFIKDIQVKHQKIAKSSDVTMLRKQQPKEPFAQGRSW
jgi:hypothetical protein